MATTATLDNIRHTLEKYVGKKILLKANKGRKQIVTKQGVLETVYPSVFVIKVGHGEGGYERVAYSYSDLLTETVKIKVFKSNKVS
ncbi:Veg family protein [Peptostreptococcus equinus]|uniref:Veg family protein n=1 Tax=Peptostreptococcus equinus TaxID=3003601 RepID=A0ABY7JR86_9FIRM|nr:Veg family protein [Peptostreptococcus sp. CBA3647]WAW14999.1 Veg family protein [Peptostreptococcus sp. CBA3647]